VSLSKGINFFIRKLKLRNIYSKSFNKNYNKKSDVEKLFNHFY
jgi:hypothetical protein